MKLSKLKFILLVFILISMISVALAETNQSTTTDGEMKKDEGNVLHRERITILSIIFVAISLLLNHFMEDHDNYVHRLIAFQHYYKSCKENKSGDCFNYLKKGNLFEKDLLEDYLLFRVTLMHFGHIAFTVIFCFVSATVILMLLTIEFIKIFTPNSGLINNCIIGVFSIIIFILLSQLWVFTRQGNMIARCIKRLQDIGLEEKFEKKLTIKDETCKSAEKTYQYKFITKCRLFLAREKKDKYRDLYTDLLVGGFTTIILIVYIFYIPVLLNVF